MTSLTLKGKGLCGDLVLHDLQLVGTQGLHSPSLPHPFLSAHYKTVWLKTQILDSFRISGASEFQFTVFPIGKRGLNGRGDTTDHRVLQPECLSAPEVTTTLLEYWARVSATAWQPR